MVDVVLLIAHGSRNPSAGIEHARLCAEVAARSRREVRPAFLEIDEPAIDQAIDAAVAEGAKRVRLLPYFLHLGNHVGNDLPLLAAQARRRHPGVAIEVDEHIGADPALVDLVARRVTTVLSSPQH